MSLHLALECLTDVAITAQSATIGGHRALDFIPGSQLLGVVAGKLYGNVPVEQSWQIFHSGAVRFGNALPIGSDGSPALPMPLALHVAKGVPKERDGILTGDVVNLLHHVPARGTQFVQLRDDFLDRCGRLHRPVRRTTMRTAIGAGGRARDGLLYEITAIAAGTRLLARIDADDEALLSPVREALVGGSIRVGRSRSAEYGLVRVEQVEAWPGLPSAGSADPRRAWFWCLSDVCLRDALTGQPSHSPAPEAFGLPATWELDARSFLRFRRYSPFNGTRKRPDLERQVIVAGSVLSFAGDEPYDPARVEGCVAQRVGEYVADGLGHVVFAPALLAGERPQFDAVARPPVAEHAPVDPPDDELARWMVEQTTLRRRREAAWRLALEWSAELDRWPALPPAQWGEVRRIARQHAPSDGDALLQALGRFVSETTRSLERRWGAARRQAAGQERLGEALLRLVGGIAAPERAATTELLASQIVRRQRTRRE